MSQIRLDLDDYTIRVLDVVKGKYGYKNRAQALNRFAKDFGDNFLEPQIDESVLRELDLVVREHELKYGDKTMSEKELAELLELDE